MKVELTRTGAMSFSATSEDGHTVLLDGPAKLGGKGHAMRPMEMFLASLAGCTSVDMVMILEKQRHTIEDYCVIIEGTRADAVPAVYEKIHLRFELKGEIPDNKLQRAARLSVEKYCSVASMLLPSVIVTHEAVLVSKNKVSVKK